MQENESALAEATKALTEARTNVDTAKGEVNKEARTNVDDALHNASEDNDGQGAANRPTGSQLVQLFKPIWK